MTILASLRKSQRHVIRVAGLLEIRQVAAHASRGRPGVFASRVASHAIQGRVHPCKSEACEPRMIKSHALPVVDRVAVLALRRKSCRNVVRRSGLLERFLMTGVAHNRQPLELPHRLALVTVGAVQARVTSYQREPVVMLFCALGDQAPALYRVTLFTVRAHLAAMNVGVTIGAVGPHICEDGLGVTLGTGNPLVLAAQRIFGRIVVEFRNRPDGLPSH